MQKYQSTCECEMSRIPQRRQEGAIMLFNIGTWLGSETRSVP